MIYTPPIEQSDWSEFTSHGTTIIKLLLGFAYTCIYPPTPSPASPPHSSLLPNHTLTPSHTQPVRPPPPTKTDKKAKEKKPKEKKTKERPPAPSRPLDSEPAIMQADQDPPPSYTPAVSSTETVKNRSTHSKNVHVQPARIQLSLHIMSSILLLIASMPKFPLAQS